MTLSWIMPLCPGPCFIVGGGDLVAVKSPDPTLLSLQVDRCSMICFLLQALPRAKEPEPDALSTGPSSQVAALPKDEGGDDRSGRSGRAPTDVHAGLSGTAAGRVTMSTAPQSGGGPGTVPTCEKGGFFENGATSAREAARPSATKLLRLLSGSRPRPAGTERPRSVVLVRSASTWTALASLRKAGSFKRLKASVLQGIQSREGAREARESASEPEPPKPVHNGAPRTTPQGRGASPGRAGASDGSDPEEAADDAFQRSTHRSRSLRRAYGLGRIRLLDTDTQQQQQPSVQDPPPGLGLGRGPTSCRGGEGTLRRSKSTDNPRSPTQSSCKRKFASSLAELKVVRDQPLSARTLSSSSADSERSGGSERSTKRWKSPIRARDFDRVLKLVSGGADAVWRREVSREPEPKTRPCSALHDDYSRRVSACSEQPLRRGRSVSMHSMHATEEFEAAPKVDADTAVFPLEPTNPVMGPSADSTVSSPTVEEGHSEPLDTRNSGVFSPVDSEQLLMPPRPATPKPLSPQSPGAGSAGIFRNLSKRSLNLVDREDRTQEPAQRDHRPESVQCLEPSNSDNCNLDGVTNGHIPPSPKQEKKEVVRAALTRVVKHRGCLLPCCSVQSWHLYLSWRMKWANSTCCS